MVKVLLIEDDLLFRNMFNDMLVTRFPNVSITESDSCANAWGRITLQPPDLIFTDIKLPDGNGLALTGKIKKQYPEITIVVLSLSDFPEYHTAAIDFGADHFISKDTLYDEWVVKLIESLFKG